MFFIQVKGLVGWLVGWLVGCVREVIILEQNVYEYETYSDIHGGYGGKKQIFLWGGGEEKNDETSFNIHLKLYFRSHHTISHKKS